MKKRSILTEREILHLPGEVVEVRIFMWITIDGILLVGENLLSFNEVRSQVLNCSTRLKISRPSWDTEFRSVLVFGLTYNFSQL